MKTNYAKLGQEAMARLEASCSRAAFVQQALLEGLLRRNRDTVYGRKYGFNSIRSAEEYQRRVPVSSYRDYEAYILRMIDGEERVLTAERAAYYCISSGTTGEAKYVPLTETDLNIQCIYAYSAVFGMVREYYKDWPEDDIFGKIFQIGEFARTCMKDGTMNGIRSGCIYQWMDRDGGFDASDYCAPKEVLFPDELEDLLYVKARFALAERGLRAIHGVFVNRVAGAMDYIRRNWDTLLRDMETGGVDAGIPLSGRWRDFVKKSLPPDPQRARELGRYSGEDLRRGMIQKIWPDVRYVLAIGGKTFPWFTERMREYAGNIPIHSYAYAASEGIFGLAERMDGADAYILLPETGFFEFLPLEREAGGNRRPLFMWELRKGMRYELLFTSHSGLYRYEMGDVIEVSGFHGQAPVVRFCYRKHQIVNIAGEKCNQEQLEAAIEEFARGAGLRIAGYSVQEDLSGALPRYLFYIEYEGALAAGAEERLDSCLCRANFEYKGCRLMHEIGRPRISRLCAGSFRRYEARLAAGGSMMGQHKGIRILDTEEKKQFFASQQAAAL